jgi:hypothetical protein
MGLWVAAMFAVLAGVIGVPLALYLGRRDR